MMHNNSNLKFNDETIFDLVQRMNINLLEHRKKIWSEFFRYYEKKRSKLSDERKIGAIVTLIYDIDDGYTCEEDIVRFIISMVKKLNLATPVRTLYKDDLNARNDLDEWSETLPKYTVILGKRRRDFEMIYDLHSITVLALMGVPFHYTLNFYQGETLCHIAKPGETYVAKKRKLKKSKEKSLPKETKRVGGVTYQSLTH